MIDLSLIEPALVAIVQDLTGVQAVAWSEQPATMAQELENAEIDLSIVSWVSLGSDDRRYEREEGSDGDPWGGFAAPVREEVRGAREITVRFKCTSFDDVGGRSGRYFAQKISDRITLNSARAALLAVGLGFGSRVAFVDLSAVVDGRRRSIAAIDVRFNAISVERAADTITTIEEVEFDAPV